MLKSINHSAHAAGLPVAGAVQADKLVQMAKGGGALPSNSLIDELSKGK